MMVQVLTPPTVEPLSLEDVKQHMRIDFDLEDSLIEEYIMASRMVLEANYQRAIMQQTRLLALDTWYEGFVLDHVPESDYQMVGYGYGYGPGWVSSSYNRGVIGLTPPVTEIVSVQYTDPTGVQQTMDPSTYLVDTISIPGRLYLPIGGVWPTIARLPNAVQITFKAGEASQDLVPRDIKMALRLLVGHFHENREQVIVALGHLAKALDLPRGVEYLMTNYTRTLVA